MASRFATVSKDEILAVTEVAAPKIPRKRQNLACRCLLVGGKKFSRLICNKIVRKNDPKNTVS